MSNTCSNCRFWIVVFDDGDGSCRFMPHAEAKHKEDWCGQHQPITETKPNIDAMLSKPGKPRYMLINDDGKATAFHDLPDGYALDYMIVVDMQDRAYTNWDENGKWEWRYL